VFEAITVKDKRFRARGQIQKPMKALVLAGGFGTRLRPLSCTRPKLLFPIANRPLLDWTLDKLSKTKVEEVVLAVNYMADVLERSFGSSRYGMKLRYSREIKPLGTGGPMKLAESFLSDGSFLAMNGDILSDLDLKKLVESHKKSGATATIALHEVDDPSRYGVVELDGENRIRRFVEKPKPSEAPSKLVNAGVYVLEPSVLDLIQRGRKVSVEREVFPILASEGTLRGHVFNGLWTDIGKPSDYVQANRRVLEQVANSRPQIGKNATIHNSSRVISPSIIGENATIADEACIGPYAVVGDDVTVRKGVRIENSVVFPSAWIDNFTSVRGAIIGEGAIVGQWVKIESQVIVGDHAVIYDNVTLTQEVSVCPSKEVDESVLEPRQVM